jgi:multiple antibiotic resistance protein
MRTFWLCFVPLFIAVDPPGILPLFLSLTRGVDEPRRHRLVLVSGLTAAGVGLTFLALGNSILIYLGITLSDFMIAGGLLLLVLSITDLLSEGKRHRRADPESVGVVPIGVPLIAGPAVLTTALLLAREHGYGPTAAALVGNVALAMGTLWASDRFHRILGGAGEKILSKITSLLLAAVSVMLVRKGLEAALGVSGR